MEKLKASHPVEVRWRSFELRPAGTEISPEYRKQIEAKRPLMEQMAKEQYGLDINAGPFGIDSRPALIGAKFAEAQGKGESYHNGVFEAYWKEGLDIEDTAVLRQIADESGIAPDEFIAALDDAQFEQEVSADIDQAFAFGLSGVPALIFANKYLVSGAQPYEVLVQVTEKVLEEMG